MEYAVKSFVASLKSKLNSEHFTALEACLDCRNCGSACAWYLATGKDDLHPKYKKDFIRSVYRRYLTLSGRILGRLGLIPTPTEADLRRHMEYYWKCTACGRCTLACPLGLSNRSITRLARAAYADSRLSRENPTLRAIWDNSENARHSFGMSPNNILARIGFFLLHENVEIPLGVEHAEYMYLCSAAGTARFPDASTHVFKLLNTAGVDYTVSPRVFDPGTDIDHIVAHLDLTRDMLLAVEAEAERLQVQKIILAECACDVRTFYVEVNRTLGRPFRFPVISLDALLLNLIQRGRLPVDKLPQTMTLHDPCYVTRLSGLGELERDLLRSVAEHFVEMTPRGEQTYCCNGGVGPMRLPELAPLRREISILKARQIKETGAEWVVTPCAVCTLSLTDLCQHHQVAVPGRRMVYLMYEVVYMAMEAALLRRDELDRMHYPAGWFLRPPAARRRVSARGFFTALMQSPQYAAEIRKLAGDDFVARYVAAHPDAQATLQALQAGHLHEIKERIASL